MTTTGWNVAARLIFKKGLVAEPYRKMGAIRTHIEERNPGRTRKTALLIRSRKKRETSWHCTCAAHSSDRLLPLLFDSKWKGWKARKSSCSSTRYLCCCCWIQCPALYLLPCSTRCVFAVGRLCPFCSGALATHTISSLGTLGGNQLTLSTNWTRPSLHFQWRCQKRDKQLDRAVLTNCLRSSDLLENNTLLTDGWLAPRLWKRSTSEHYENWRGNHEINIQ